MDHSQKVPLWGEDHGVELIARCRGWPWVWKKVRAALHLPQDTCACICHIRALQYLGWAWAASSTDIDVQ